MRSQTRSAPPLHERHRRAPRIPRAAQAWRPDRRRRRAPARAARAARLAVDRERRRERRAARRAAAQHLAAAAGHRAGSSASNSSNQRCAAPQREAERHPVAEHLAALLAEPVRRPCPRGPTVARGTGRAATAVRRPSRVDVAMAIAREAEPVGSLQEVKGGGPRPRGSARHLPQHADHARDRGARPHPLQAGEDPGLVLHGPRQRGRRRRRRDRDGPGRRRHAAPPRHGRARHARRRAVADLRPVHGPRRRADAAAATATSTWPTRGSA